MNYLRRWTSRPSHLLLIAVVLAYGVYGIFFAERILINNGYGPGDGQNYGRWAQNFIQTVFVEKELDIYALHRILPSACVYSILKIVGAIPSRENVVLGFAVFNFTVIFISLVLWLSLLDRYKVPPLILWMGSILLFLNAFTAKMNFYLPVLTDGAMFAVGMLFLYSYLTEKTILLAVSILVSNLVLPEIALYCGAMMFLFPKRVVDEQNSRSLKLNENTSHVFAFLASAFISALFVMFYYKDLHIMGIPKTPKLLPVSVMATLIYIYFLSYYLFREVEFPRLTCFAGTLFSGTFLLRFVALISMAGLIYGFFFLHVSSLSSFPGFLWTLMMLVCKSLICSVARPFSFLVGHTVYFGLLVPFVVVLWPHIAKELKSNWVLAFVVYLWGGYAMLPESRHIVFILPFCGFFLTLALSKRTLSMKWILILSILAFGYSQVWLPMNSDDPATIQYNYDLKVGYLMTLEMYLYHLIHVIPAFIVAFLATHPDFSLLIYCRSFYQTRPQTTTSSPS